MDYGNRLRALREDADKTQAQIARTLGTTQQYYGKYESGERPLPVERPHGLSKTRKGRSPRQDGRKSTPNT